MSANHLNDHLLDKVGFLPEDSISWLYVARGFYKTKNYPYAIEAVQHCLRTEATQKEAQHILSYSYYHSGQSTLAARAFFKSVHLGNDSDWQSIVELAIDHPDLNLHNT